uniref:Glycosyl hydrolase family 32 N-terminal domain-containing protein n=1 Tax=viral metagenome TaxID=1070528 RepID=A0A6C0H136_9ZZZZ
MNQSIIDSLINIGIKTNKFKLEKTININRSLGYPFIINIENKNYIYYREDATNYIRPDDEVTNRLILEDFDNIILDINYELKLGKANHNFRLFNFNNKLYGIGGMGLFDANYKNFKDSTNDLYLNYNKDESISLIEDSSLNKNIGSKILNPKVICPYYANGLHLFLFNDINNKIYIKENNELPIVSSIMNGRHDGHWGYCNHTDIEASKGGISLFDSSTSILFNYNDNKYYLYQRANLGLGVRFIQYTTSNNLIDWSDFNLININPKIDFFQNNYYYNNFFSIKDIDIYIGLFPHSKKNGMGYYDIDNKEYLELYYSKDCINWNYIGVLLEFEYHNKFLILGEPIIKNNKYYFYASDHKCRSINVYSIEKNRFSSAYTIENDKISKINLKLIKLNEPLIKINFKTYSNGFIKIQLLNNNKEIIDNFSFNDFDIIKENLDDLDYTVSWKNNNNIPNNEIYIEIEGINFEMFLLNNLVIF